ncbi:protein kinase [Actinoplanes sp. TRM 88003]|uniref:non-specific serine/threonine protein kinase n=1 Tax=Paractinoplanes aksuensis TaxID=2939490 RepID=A0ABT1DLV5_9ACTN|nr:serine/threonine-protein kinase [Actinoplanes aksuensis]MCO8271805.1 protein kinase [Actinoplanes aksuensis]
MGQVWPGRDTKLDREVVVKFVRLPRGTADEDHIRRRFRRESRITARLAHPGVPAVYDVGVDDGRPFIVMQRVHGISVADLVAEQGPLPIGLAATIAAQICAVLAVAHRESLVHRDLKPANLMLEPNGAVKVLDFGLAVAPTLADYSRITQTGEYVGTPAYMAPEQVEANHSEPATDLYALGCTLHEMLSGERLFPGSVPYTIMLRQVHDTPEPLRSLRSDVPAELEQLVLQLLEKRPEDRPAEAEEVYRRLLPFAADLGPLDGVLSREARRDPARLYAAALSRPEISAVVPAPRVESVPATEPVPPVTRQDLVRARTDARRLTGQSRFDQAAAVLAPVEKNARRAFGNTDPEVIEVRQALAAALFEGGDFRRAAPVFHALAADLTGDSRFDCLYREAICLAETGQSAQAMSRLTALLADGDPRSLRLRKEIGLLQLGAGRRAEAAHTFTGLAADLRRASDPDSAELSDVDLLLARSTHAEGVES